MLTQQELLLMKELNRTFITCIYQRETLFKQEMLNTLRWEENEYTLGRVHLSGHRVRISIEFDDGSLYDVYLNIDEVYDWILKQV